MAKDVRPCMKVIKVALGEQLKWLDETKDTNFLMKNKNNDDYGSWQS